MAQSCYTEVDGEAKTTRRFLAVKFAFSACQPPSAKVGCKRARFSLMTADHPIG
jgi:hypothetical protein